MTCVCVARPATNATNLVLRRRIQLNTPPSTRMPTPADQPPRPKSIRLFSMPSSAHATRAFLTVAVVRPFNSCADPFLPSPNDENRVLSRVQVREQRPIAGDRKHAVRHGYMEGLRQAHGDALIVDSVLGLNGVKLQ